MRNLANNQNRTLILILGAVLAVLCLCICLLVGLGMGLLQLTDQLPSSIRLPATKTDINQQMDDIQQQVALLRGIQPTSQVTRTLINTDQLRLKVSEEFLNEYSPEEAQTDALVLTAFGLLEADFDLLDFYLELYTEQIAGYYDHDTKEMFIVQDSGFNISERLTYAHEFTHVLQDQTFEIREGLRYNEEDCEDSSERCLGIQSLLEGDASFLELQWFEQYATITDRTQMMNLYANTHSPVYDTAPSFIKEDLVFPYTQGYNFVAYLHQQGGWEAINQAYALPPVSSEQILHPERYPAEMPKDVSLPDIASILSSDWVEIEHGVMGEWYTFLILAHGFDPGGRVEIEQAQEAAAGWGGDAFITYFNPDHQSLVMSLITSWDSETDAQEFEQAFQAYLNGRFGQETGNGWMSPTGQHKFVRQGDQTIWLLAPGNGLVSALWTLLTMP